jgi:hypothetical protein
MASACRTVFAVCSIGAAAWACAAAAADPPGARPGDDALTCAQIAGELAPYMQRIMPGAVAVGTTAQEVTARGQQHVAEETPAAIALTAAATASTADPTAASSRAVGQVEAIHQQEAWQRTLAEDKPLHDKYNGEVAALAAQGQQLQSDARLQRLMQLVGEKHCDSR